METVSGTTIYQRIGGEAAISSAVDRFYERALADPTLSHFFRGVSMARPKAHQFAFLSQALGGPKQYGGASICDAHRHFDSVAVHLVETLRELGVPEDIISEIAAAVTPLSSQIVNAHLGQ